MLFKRLRVQIEITHSCKYYPPLKDDSNSAALCCFLYKGQIIDRDHVFKVHFIADVEKFKVANG